MTQHVVTERELIGRIKTLSEKLWESHCRAPEVEEWLDNFDGSKLTDLDSERLHALHLLAHVSYFGLRELRVLLRAMYRDHFRYPILQMIRSKNAWTRDLGVINTQFDLELMSTRFLGMGNPAESGTHLLYYFRQENRLPKRIFVQQHSLLSGPVTDPKTVILPTDLKRLVFVDDLCGSGTQARDYSRTLLQDIQTVAKRENRSIEFQYLVLFGTEDGMKRVATETSYDIVRAVSEIDQTYKTFGSDSRVFRKPMSGIDAKESEKVSRKYGEELWKDWPVGFDDGQLLLAFHHNVPDNSLPILWFDEDPKWRPAFPRNHKVD